MAKSELVNAKTGKPSYSIDEDLIQKSEYEKRQHPESPKKKTFSEKVKEFHEQTAQGLANASYAAHEKHRGYKEHR